MKPPYEITAQVVNLIGEISESLGKLGALTLATPEPRLRRKNQIRTIKGTLAIEGNTFTEDQITEILDNKKVVGAQKEILEVKNAIALYESITAYKSSSTKSFLKAHAVLMKGLIDGAGRFRTKNVGVLKGQAVKHVAPKPMMVPELMGNLLDWLKKEKGLHALIKSCVAHYEIEFIHPFEDGNGRMGRFWQFLILTEFNPIFKYVPVESLVEREQVKYYEALEKSDMQGTSTPFIEFMLSAILSSLREFDSETRGRVETAEDRMNKARLDFRQSSFSRKDYMQLFKSISSATASRDLRKGVELETLVQMGAKNQTRYKFR